MTSTRRLRILQSLTVLVPAICAGLYETVRHTVLANDLPYGLGTALAAALVLAISFAFARVSFGIIRRMEARLIERNRALEALSREVERLAVIEERDRLAREMHDGIAQVLAYLLVRLDTIEGLVERGRTAEAAAEVRRLRDSGAQAYDEVREAIAGLRTQPAAGAAGLAVALGEYTRQFADRTGLDAGCTVGALDTAAGDLPPAAELHLMRIAQEALANVRKHSGARRVDVSFGKHGDAWVLEVRDDGAGFDPATPPPDDGRHFGLAMMRERAEAMGARLDVTAAPGGGATVRAIVPADGAGRSRANRRLSSPAADDEREPDTLATRRQPARPAVERAARLAG